jgi:hypothetical protein
MVAKVELSEALRPGCGCLGRAALTSRFSSFVLKTSSHQRWWFDRLIWLSRLEVPHDKVRAALQVAKQMADWQANNQHRVKVPD